LARALPREGPSNIGDDPTSPSHRTATSIPLPSGRDWLYDPSFDLYLLETENSILKPLTNRSGYDAEPAFSWDGQRIIFTVMTKNRCYLETMLTDGSGRTRLLGWSGYIGGACFSPSGQQIVFQATRQDNKPGLALYLCEADGSQVQLLTAEGSYSFSPCWHPHEELIIYSSNIQGPNYELYTIKPDGSGRQQITFQRGLDAFPVFSRDGKQLLWTSQRHGPQEGTTHIYKATWIP
jgi:Tol biopolymer transport system component